ncbi:MAG: energy transducer TonB [Bacteroidota bacterium]
MNQSVSISSNDRMSFTFIFAIAIHALIILGIGFEFIRSQPAPSSSIEIILTKTENIEEPDDAKVIAEHNQKQSGRIDQDARPTSPSMTQNTFLDKNKISNDASNHNTAQLEQNEMLINSSNSDLMKIDNQVVEDTLKQNIQHSRKSPQNVAQLVSELNREKQLYAKRPRINHIDTLSAKSAIEAKYIKDWVEKVEITGNLNYPNRAKQNSLSGTLIMSVLINQDGKVISSTIQKSSGLSILDNAAKKIVSLAAPFKQFPNNMRDQYDQLMITRTWIYDSNNTFTTK